MSIDSENPLLLEVLTASSTSYTYKPDDQIVDVIRTWKIWEKIYLINIISK